ncbi:MAG: roadblock/LC7 domain-containing protein [Promethearchaeota archaeon]
MSLNAEEAEILAVYLGKITENTELEALALVTRDGTRLAFSAIPGYEINPDHLSSMSAVILQSASDAVKNMKNFDRLSECVIRAKNSFLVLAAAGRFFLIGASRETKDLGKVVSVFRYYAKKISESYPE